MHQASPETPRPMPSPGVLHLLCGKIAAGKSTLATRLADSPLAVLIREDDWMPRLYPGEILTLDDYVRCTGRLRAAMAGHLANLLRAGVTVVLDFPSNTPASRAWARTVFEAAGAPHVLHFLDVPDEVCRARMHARNASGEHPYQVSDAEFDQFTSRFVAPADDEGFEVMRYA